jgi:hypothetical protein
MIHHDEPWIQIAFLDDQNQIYFAAEFLEIMSDLSRSHYNCQDICRRGGMARDGSGDNKRPYFRAISPSAGAGWV